MTVAAFVFSGQVRAPEWSDALDRKTPALESALALALGLVTLVLGIFFCLVVPVVVVASVIAGEFASSALVPSGRSYRSVPWLDPSRDGW
jgi:uncharacterized protein YqhQ